MTYEIIWDQPWYIEIIWGHLRTFSRSDASQGFILHHPTVLKLERTCNAWRSRSRLVLHSLARHLHCALQSARKCDIVWCSLHFYIFLCIFPRFDIFFVLPLGAKFNPAWRSQSRLVLHSLARHLHCALQSARKCDIVWCSLHFSTFWHVWHFFCIATRWYSAKFNPAWRSRSRLIHGLARPLHCELQSVHICAHMWYCVMCFACFYFPLFSIIFFPHLPGEVC